MNKDMTIFSEISGIISDMQTYLGGVDGRSYLQSRIYLKNRINEVGRKMNELFYSDVSRTDTRYSDELLKILVELKPVFNHIPVTPELSEVSMLGQSLLYYLLVNYIYVAREEVEKVTSFAMTLSDLLSGLPEPTEVYPKEWIHNLIDEKKIGIEMVYKLYDGVCVLYRGAIVSSIAVDEETHLEWISQYFRNFETLRVILEIVINDITSKKETASIFSDIDAVVSNLLHFSEVVSTVMATYPTETLSRFGGIDGLFEGLSDVQSLLDRGLNLVIDMYDRGQISRNDNPWENRVFIMANFGREYFNFKQRIKYLYREGFENKELVDQIDDGLELYAKLRSLMKTFGFTISKSPFTPVAVSILMKVVELLFLLDENDGYQEAPEQRALLFKTLEEDFSDIRISSLFDLNYSIATLYVQDCLKDRMDFEKVNTFLSELRTVPRILNADMISVTLLSELFRLCLGGQSLDNTILNLQKFDSTYLVDDPASHHAFSRYINKLKGSEELHVPHNLFDPFTWMIPKFSYGGKVIPFVAFNSSPSKLLGKYPVV